MVDAAGHARATRPNRRANRRRRPRSAPRTPCRSRGCRAAGQPTPPCAAGPAERCTVERPGTAREHDRGGAERTTERDREARVQKLVGARVACRHDGDRHRQGREHAEDDGPPGLCACASHEVVIASCRGVRPPPAGSSGRSRRRQRSASARTGSAWKSTAADSEYSGRRCASALEKPNRRHAAAAP